MNSYPTVRGFTAIGTGGDDFVQAMVVAVESVLQQPIPEVKCLTFSLVVVSNDYSDIGEFIWILSQLLVDINWSLGLVLNLFTLNQNFDKMVLYC